MLDIDMTGAVPVNQLTIMLLREHLKGGEYLLVAPDDFLTRGLIIDTCSISALLTVYEALTPPNQRILEDESLVNSRRLVVLLDRMWDWFK